MPTILRNLLRRLLPVTPMIAALFLSACALTPQQPEASRHSMSTSKMGDEAALRAVSMLGRPYQWGGSSPREGFDCSGLAVFAWREAAGIKLPRTARQMSGAGRSVGKKWLLPGDLVFFNTQRRRYSHVGVYVGNGRFVHAPSKGKNIRLAKLSNPYWSKRYNGARRPTHP